MSNLSSGVKKPAKVQKRQRSFSTPATESEIPDEGQEQVFNKPKKARGAATVKAKEEQVQVAQTSWPEYFVEVRKMKSPHVFSAGSL